MLEAQVDRVAQVKVPLFPKIVFCPASWRVSTNAKFPITPLLTLPVQP